MKPKNSNFDRFFAFINFCRGNRFQFDTSLTEASFDSIDFYKRGSKIKIKKENRGKFTQSANRSGMGVQEFASHVLSNKDKYSATQVKRANFARNTSKWKHKNNV